MNMILWNTAKKKIEALYDARTHYFAPDEKKIFACNTEFDRALVNHLIFHLEPLGLVAFDENASPEEVRAAYVKGVKNRWRQMDFLCRNFKEMNKEREANKMSSALPDDRIFEAAEEAKKLLAELRNLEAEKFKAVDDYLNDSQMEKAQELLSETESEVKTSGITSEITPKGQRKK